MARIDLPQTSRRNLLIGLVTALFLGFAVALGYLLFTLTGTVARQAEDLAALRTIQASSSLEFADELYMLKNALHEVTTRNISLEDALDAERERMENLRTEVGDFGRSVETLEKLTKTDPQLLQKYSKVYFLNEHYMPADLVVIEEKYDLPNGRQVSVHADMWPHLRNLLQAAWRDGEQLMVLSGYRSFNEQSALKSQYKVTYGAGSANTFSADQGYSEHQLGTTVDFTTKELGATLSGFDRTSAYQWLLKNAHTYGFILSYPENNEHYIFEPWHWRFVGRDLARYLVRRGVSFYELDQRTIDEYLPDLFD